MKKEYISPKIKVLDICGRRNLLDGIGVGGTVGDEGDIGFSKRNNFFDDEEQDFHYDVWDHQTNIKNVALLSAMPRFF